MELKNRKKEERKKGEIDMNFKKVLSIASVASLAVVGLASCGKKKETVEEYTGAVNVAATYKGIGYLTYGRGTGTHPATYSTVDGRTLTKNETLTPIWQDIGTNLGVTIQDAALQADSTASAEKALITANYVGYQGRKADVFETTQGDDYNSEINNGNIVNLLPYIKMGKKGPLKNLAQWLEDHPNVYSQMIVDEGGKTEGIYYTPYFDGLDQNEQQFNMNIDIVKALLDPESSLTDEAKQYYNQAQTGDYDTKAMYASGFAYNTPFISGITNQEIAVARQTQTGLDTAGQARIDDNDRTAYTSAAYVEDKITVSIAAGDTIIDRMNALTVKNGKTLTECLKTYLNEKYGQYVGEGKLYKNLSDIYISTSACYNVDELIALLRCVKANPAFLSGNANATMIPIFPRTGESGRIRRLISCMQMFGIRGLEGEKDRYWITADGKLTDGRTQEFLLYGLTLMNQLQQDKLFPENEGWTTDGSTVTGDFRKTALKDGYAFMTNDYANVAAFNYESTNEGKCYNITGVLPPVTKWAFTCADGSNTKTKKNPLITGAQEDEKFSYTRFSEDDRSMKDGGWSIVASSVEGNKSKLYKILEMFDYMYTPEGSVLECFGYNAQASDERKAAAFNKRGTAEEACDNYKGEADEYLAKDDSGNYYVNVADAFKIEQYARTSGTWHNYMTQYWGACLGIGNIRTNYLEGQLTGPMQKVGMTKLTNARGANAYYLATTTGSNFLSVVKTTLKFDATQTAANVDGDDLKTFWNNENGSPYYKIVEKGWSSQTTYNTPATVIALYKKYNDSVLKNTGLVWDLKVDSTNQYTFNTYTL